MIWESCNYQTWSVTAYLNMIYEGLFGSKIENGKLSCKGYLPTYVGFIKLSDLETGKKTYTVTVTENNKTIIEEN